MQAETYYHVYNPAAGSEKRFLEEEYYPEVLQSLPGLKNKSTEKIIIQSFSNLFDSQTKAFKNKHRPMASVFIPGFNKKEINQPYLPDKPLVD